MSDVKKKWLDEIRARRERLEDLRKRAEVHGADTTRAKFSAPKKAKLIAAPAGESKDAAPGDRAKRAADFLLKALTADDGGKSPRIEGTRFTEASVKRFCDELSKRSASAGPMVATMLQKVNKFVTQPPADGTALVHGINVRSLERLVTILERIKTDGLAAAREALRGEGGGAGPRPGAKLNAVKAAPSEDARMRELQDTISRLENTVESLTSELEQAKSRGRKRPAAKKAARRA